jgi:proline racemase
MTLLNQELGVIVAGDHKDITRTVKNVPSGAVLATGWLTIKEDEDDADVAAIIQKSITSSPSSSGQITDTGADGTGAATLSCIQNRSCTSYKGAIKFY